MITGLSSSTNLASLTLEFRLPLTSSLPRDPRSTSANTDCPSLLPVFGSKALAGTWRVPWPKSMLLHFFRIPVLHPPSHSARVVFYILTARVKFPAQTNAFFDHGLDLGISYFTQVCGSLLPSLPTFTSARNNFSLHISMPT